MVDCKYCFHDHSRPDMDDLQAACDCDCRKGFNEDRYDDEGGLIV